MNNFEKILIDAKTELYKEDCVKQYFYFKNIIQKDSMLKNLDEEMRFHQKEMCKNKQNDEIYNCEKKLYEKCKKQFESNPLLINYQIAKEEVFSLLVDIKQVLS